MFNLQSECYDDNKSGESTCVLGKEDQSLESFLVDVHYC